MWDRDSSACTSYMLLTIVRKPQSHKVFEGFLHPDIKFLCRSSKPNQAKLKIKDQVYWAKTFLGDPSAPQRWDGERRPEEITTWLPSRRKFKYLVGVVLNSSGGGAAVWWAFWEERALEWGGVWAELPTERLCPFPSSLEWGILSWMGVIFLSSSFVLFLFFIISLDFIGFHYRSPPSTPTLSRVSRSLWDFVAYFLSTLSHGLL